MRVVWFIYGDVFATHPNLTIGTAVDGVLTPINWNTSSDTNFQTRSMGYYWAPADNPLGMQSAGGWADKRVIDFGDPDPGGMGDAPWAGDDIYIDDADNPLGQINLRLQVFPNTSSNEEPTTMRLAFNQNVNWFSANPNHQFYDVDYANTTDAWNISKLIHGGQWPDRVDATSGLDEGWHAARATQRKIGRWGWNWVPDTVIYKVKLISTLTENSSTFVMFNTNGEGQTVAQRFNNATLYDATNANHVAAQRITANPHPSLQTNGTGSTGFILQGVDIANPYVNGVNIIACVQNPVRNVFTKTAGTGMTAVPLDDVYGQVDASATLTGFRSMNWTNYGVGSDNTGYSNQRPDIINYYNANGTWTIPDGLDSQTCPAGSNGTSVIVRNRFKLHTWMMTHAENAGYTSDGVVRNFGSDLNMIIPNPPG